MGSGLAGIVLALALLLPGPARAQESVVTGLSTDNIAITATFDGSEIFVFGAVRRDGPLPPVAGPLDIIITLKGPPQPVMVRRKERVLGIWINTASVRVSQAPSFYAVASTRPIQGVLTETERLRYGIGMDQAVRRVGGHPTITDTQPFAEAVVRIRQDNGLYSVLDEGVRLIEDTLFQAHFALPSNLVEGEYLAEFFLVRDRAVIYAGSTGVRVEKAGLERWIYNLSRREPLLYGVVAIAMALLAGWLAAAAFRLVRR
jgi:uncharacterized protein (TIGR02186 family)